MSSCDPSKAEPRTRLVTWNVRGLNHPVKCSKVFAHLRKMSVDIVYLQETHLLLKDHGRLHKKGYSWVYHSKFNCKSRGVAILIRTGVQFTESEVISDSNGRFVIIKGKLFGLPVVLANIYAPNWEDAGFFQHVFSLLPAMDSHKLILGADLNCVLCPKLDRSNPTTKMMSKTTQAVNSFMQAYGVIDPWRHHNPHSKAYSFFSHVHQSYSRIDHFLIDDALLPLFRSITYDAIVISDHGPVNMVLSFPGQVPSQLVWRLNPRWLSDEGFVTYLSNQIDVFLLTNNSPTVSRCTLWETMKAYIRGMIISYTANANKKLYTRQKELLNKIKEIDKQHASAPSSELYKERLLLKTEYDISIASQMQDMYVRSRSEHYEHGERAGKLLSHQLKKSASANQITEIALDDGSVTCDQRKINEQFKQFYKTLYTGETTSEDSISKILDGLEFENIEEPDKEALDQPITQEEIVKVITCLKSGKAPGPDGFPVEFYKKFSAKLAPILLEVYEECFNNETLPPTMTQAIISVLLKKDKDPLQCGSYRPVSLLGCDYKILTKMLASRLESVLPKFIHTDQTGFVIGRHLFSNLRRVFNLLYSSDLSPVPEVLISLDAMKAFDRISHNYLYKVLDKFGFGSTFQTWVKILYAAPQAAVRTDRVVSDYFPIGRGTRQGCPLSPLLFDIAIEPLAMAIRNSPLISGVKRGEYIHKVSMYADDSMFFLSNPNSSLPEVLRIISDFGRISGYKVNLAKSLIFPMNKQASQMSFDLYPFQVIRDSFTYLGVIVTRLYKDLFNRNFKVLLDRTKMELSRWVTLPLSLAGRVNSVKMTILPRFLFLFQTLPVFIPKAYFKELDQHISTFIWNKTIPRIRKEFLQRHKHQGGLGLPSFINYYWAANVHKIQFWMSPKPAEDQPLWALMERSASAPVNLAALICAPAPLSKKHLTTNPIVNATLRIWSQFRLHFKHKTTLPSSPIVGNPLFPPSLLDTTFLKWSAGGLACVKDFFVDGTFITFQLATQKYSIPNSHFFRYLQVRDYIRKSFSSFPDQPDKDWIEECIQYDPSWRGSVSRLYQMIQSVNTTTLDHIKEQWQEELGVEILDVNWHYAIERIHSSSICIRHGLMQFKILHRVHLSRARLAKIYPNTDATCLRCHLAPGTLFHMFWSCSKLRTFWCDIFDTYTQVFNRKVDPDPLMGLFGIIPLGSSFTFTASQSEIIAFTSLLARRLILLNWKAEAPPSYGRWVVDVMAHLKLERMRTALRGSQRKFWKVWQPFIDYVEDHFSPTNI